MMVSRLSVAVAAITVVYVLFALALATCDVAEEGARFFGACNATGLRATRTTIELYSAGQTP